MPKCNHQRGQDRTFHSVTTSDRLIFVFDACRLMCYRVFADVSVGMQTEDEMSPIVIWLDDMRSAHHYRPYIQMHMERLGYVSEDTYAILEVKNYAEFKAAWEDVAENVIVIFFDHNLGEERTGYDAACYVEKTCYESKRKLPHFVSQSSNPVGQCRILSIHRRAVRHGQA
jgi:hypothetical protein